MIRPSTPPILSEIRRASSPASQVKALKDLKNELIGHEQKKELWIRQGILTTLGRILNTNQGNGKKKHRETNGFDGHHKQPISQSEDDEARLQAVIVVGSLAFGGPAFVAPIYAAQLILPLLSVLSSYDSHPQTALHSLKTLNTIADSIALSSPEQEDHENSLTTLLYSHQNHLSSVSEILQQTSATPLARQQVALAASLIAKTCQKEHQRAMAAQAGILEALTRTSAPLIVESLRYPSNVKSKQLLASILLAVKAVVTGSQLRGTQILYSPALAIAFGHLEPLEKQKEDGFVFSPHDSTATQGYRTPLEAMESLLPQRPSVHARNIPKSQSIYPSHGRIGTSDSQVQSSRSLSTAIEINQNQGLEYVGGDESPLIPFLVHTFRTSDETISLAAAALLVAFYRLRLTKRPKEFVFAFLLVPSLVRMLDTESKQPHPHPKESSNTTIKKVREEASEILATLMNGCVETQNAAYDAGAIKKLSQLLKESFDPLPISAMTPSWHSESISSAQSQSREDAHRLGPAGVSVATHDILRLREAVLTALAAIASEKDEYRKAVIENGVVPFVIKSLRAEPLETTSSNSDVRTDDGAAARPESMWDHGDVVLAACGTARALSRSVSTLRTSLMDAGLPTPLFLLLKSQDLDIQIAATGVLCNLVLKFSPMREAIMDAGALTTLCTQAHSMNAKLRLNSMWALKNIIDGASNSTKKTCLEELGPGWLKQIVAHDADDSGSMMTSRLSDREDDSTPIRMSTPNAAGEQVDLLNAIEGDLRNSSQGLEENRQEDFDMSDSIGTLGKGSRERKHQFQAAQTNSPFLGLPSNNLELRHYLHRALSDELAIQKEGLEFIRNLICGDQSPEMIDHLFRELGQDKVFELLTSKLRPKVLNAFTRDRRSLENGVRQIQPHPEILTSTCFTLVHIACGHPRHRQLLVSQAELLRLLLPLFSHSCREIRVCLCWFVINVTWVEDNADKQNAKMRARELQNLGFVEKLDALENDESLDCRERAKHARDHMRLLLHV